MQLSFQSLLAADASREQIEDWCRKQTQSYTAVQEGVGAIVARVLGKYLMVCDSRDNALTPHLALNGIWEPWVTMAIAKHVATGMRCMDVGSCYGYYALLMADLAGQTGYVQAWEPYWHQFITINASINGLVVDVVEAALGSEDSVMMIKPLAKNLTAMFNAGGVTLEPMPPAAARPLHYTKAELRRPTSDAYDFIKIDVEGAEADVWTALDGVRALSPNLTVCMEFTPKAHADPSAFLNRIMGDGFEIGSVGHDGVPRCCTIPAALVPDTGGFRMLWLTRNQ